MRNIIVEFKFVCGDEIWFYNNTIHGNGGATKGIVTRSSLTNRGTGWQYTVEASYTAEDIYYSDGRLTTYGAWLVHTDKEPTVFKSYDELIKHKRKED